ncbi:MAG: polyketide synthase dehydratase domain-containing protein, partial [Acidimicrobiaceae bacterium]|nr:polyketide synthase dehydratase domain-containing protein [Acidimicrobiaceae bacterium]
GAFAGKSSAGSVPPSVHRQTLTVSLTEQPWLRDHELYRQPPEWPDDTDRFPIVPITTMVEMFADAATRLAPGRTVVSIESVRAHRWLQAAPPTTVELVASAVAPDRVEVALEGYAKATVVFGDRPDEAPLPSLEPLRSPRPSPLDPAALYREHWMFHGPAFQGIRHFAALGENGIDGELEALPTPGATLDNAGQLYGWWVMASVDRDFLALPQSIERVELFQPLSPGTRVPTRVRVREMDERTVRADLELLCAERVAVRITGWVDRRFDSDPQLWEMLRGPERHLLSTILSGVAAVVDERWPNAASRELIARRYLTAPERAEYDSLNPRAQRARLLGRVAAKDAVRAALWAEGHGQLFPHEIGIGNDDRGAPLVTSGPAQGWPLSIAHRDSVGVALVGARGGTPVGIDVELIEPRGDEAVAAILLPAEQTLLLAAFPDTPAHDWVTRAWAAKEAAAKATGQGLQGRPKDFSINAVDGMRIQVGGRWVSTVAVDAPIQDTGQKGSESRRYVIAWTDP